MKASPKSSGSPRGFAIISVLGAPGAGKGTLCSRLAETCSLVHHSVGDGLRSWMRENRDAPLAFTIQDKLDNQGFLTSKELNPFILRSILEQLDSWSVWPFSEELPLEDALHADAKPDVVLSLRVDKQNAKSRYSARARESNDSDEKFERRLAEYETETLPVGDAYCQRGLLIDIDVNETKEQNITEMTKKLGESGLWQKAMTEGQIRTRFRPKSQ